MPRGQRTGRGRRRKKTKSSALRRAQARQRSTRTRKRSRRSRRGSTPPGNRGSWFKNLPKMGYGDDRTLVDLRDETPMIGGWGGMNYNVLMPANPDVDAANQLSATEQMQLFTMMANTPLGEGGGGGGGGSGYPPYPTSGDGGYQPPEVKWKVGLHFVSSNLSPIRFIPKAYSPTSLSKGVRSRLGPLPTIQALCP